MSDRDTALDALRRRLIQAAKEEDGAGLLTAEAVREAAELAAVTDPERDLDAAMWLGMFHFLRYRTLPQGDDIDDYAAAARLLRPVHRADPDLIPGPLRRRYERGLDRPEADPVELSGRAIELVRRYRSEGQSAVLAEAVRLFRAAAAAMPGGDPERPGYLSDLGAAQRIQAELTGNPGLLTEAIGTLRTALAATPADDPDLAARQSNLAAALMLAAKRTGDPGPLTEAIALLRAAAAAVPADDRPAQAAIFSNLGVCLVMKHERTREAGPIGEAVEAHHAALAATPAGHPDRAGRLSNLGNALHAEFELTADPALITEAIRALREAVEASTEGHPDHGSHLSNLGAAMTRRSEYDGDTDALTQAVGLLRAALGAIPTGHPERASCLSNFAAAATRLAGHGGDLALLAEGIEASRSAVRSVAADDPELAGYLCNLGLGLQTWFEYTGRVELLEEAIGAYRGGASAADGGHRDHGMSLSLLGLALRMLFEYTGETALLVEAVQASRAAVALSPPAQVSHAGLLVNLGGNLQVMFERTGQADLLAEAVEVLRAAVAGYPDGHPDKGAALSNLGLALQDVFDKTGRAHLLGEGIDAHRAAVAATGDRLPERARYESNLGLTLRAMFERDGKAAWLAEALTAFRSAVAATPADYPDQATYLTNLGNCLQLIDPTAGDRGLLGEAADCYARAAENAGAPTLVRIQAYRQLSRLSDSGEAGLAAMEKAVSLLPRIAPGTLMRADRENRLGQLAGLAGEAAAAAVSAGRPRRAAELLEQTRGILVSDTLQARSGDLARLRGLPGGTELADAYEDLRARLDVFDWVGPGANHAPRPAGQPGLAAARPSAATLARIQQETHRAWEKLVSEIRASGFEGFLRAPDADQLAAQAHEGPLIYIFTSPARCDALILLPDPLEPVRVVSLADRTEADAYRQANRFHEAQIATADPGSGGSWSAAQYEVLDILAWMWDAITQPIMAALGYTAAPGPDEAWPRVWWCPTGVLAYLPLHAAGHHRDLVAAEPTHVACPRTVLDRVVSSYIPTIRGLAYARAGQAAPTDRATLIVAVPEAPSTPPLAGAAAEAAAIAGMVPGAQVLAGPTRDAVLDALPRHLVAHFACHGYVDLVNPAASRLILPDHEISPLTVGDIMVLALTAGLAYLSACETGVARPDLADESLHITGAFHLAGYRHVIGTLWPISDAAAKRLAVDVYRRLTRDGGVPDPALAPRSLHDATRDLRMRYLQTPTLWAAHTHVGA